MKLDLYHYLYPFVQKTDNKKLIAIPLAILAAALLIIAFMIIQTGSPVALGMDFVGGTQFSATTTLTENQLQEMFSGYPLNDIRISGNRAVLQFSMMGSDELQTLENLIYNNPAFRDIEQLQISPIYGQELQRSALIAVVLSLIGMAFVVFIIFRQIVPSLSLVFKTIANIIIPLAVMNILGIELTLGTIAALLMIIAFSVDSDILLANKVLKRSGNLDDKISAAMRTGMFMTTTTAAAFFVMFVVSTFAHYIIPGIPPIPIMSQISLIVLIGLVADIWNTWFFNVGVLRMYLTRPKGRSKKGGRRA
ncbi:MAG: protein translocase subunit SecF [Methanosarcinales archaeon]|nr:protein translocase subunit SecF [Methanosarcinales archaeon]